MGLEIFSLNRVVALFFCFFFTIEDFSSGPPWWLLSDPSPKVNIQKTNKQTNKQTNKKPLILKTDCYTKYLKDTGVQFCFSLRESNLIATTAITLGFNFNEGSWFLISYNYMWMLHKSLQELILWFSLNLQPWGYNIKVYIIQTRSSKNWPRVTGPTEHGVFKVISWRGIWHTNFEGGIRSSTKLASSVRQGLWGMGCSKLLAEGGIGQSHRAYWFWAS